MKYVIYFLILFCYAANGQKQNNQWKEIWVEDFSDIALNEDYWNYEVGDGCPNLCGWGNNERQIYTKTNHQLKDGFLHITAKKSGDRYTSARITTKQKFEFQYGKIEIRAQLPRGKGLWPAFWMLGSNIEEVGWPLCGEIDVLEYVGKSPGEIFTSLHTMAGSGNKANTKTTSIPGIEEGFHLYSAIWSSQKIEFFVDRIRVYSFAPSKQTTETWPFDQSFYFILNLAVGGYFGGPEVDDTIFPQDFIVDYIKVYQNN